MTEPPYVDDRPSPWPRRLAVIGSFAAAVTALVVVVLTTLHVGVGAGGAGPAAAAPTVPLKVRLLGNLAAPVQSAAGVPLATGEGMLVVGGLNPAGAPVNTIQEFSGSKASTLGILQSAVRGGAAVLIGTRPYLLGGVGAPAGGTAILNLAGVETAPPRQAAALPRPVADSAGASLDGVAFLFGGFTGQQPTATVFAWQPGGAPHPTAHLPSRLLYDTAVTVANRVIILGGTVNGAPSRAILSFDPLAHSVTTIGQLPIPLSHAVAGVIDGQVFVIGGRVTGPTSQTRAIYRFDPGTRASTFAGALPVALSDAAVASTNGKILVAGGLNRAGQAQSTVYEISTH